MGTLTRLGDDAVDVVVIVAEPTTKSIEVGSRVAELARERRIGRVLVVANRVRGAEDEARMRATFQGLEIFVVPDDAAIVECDRDGVAPMDAAPRSAAVLALAALAGRLVEPPLDAAV